MSSHLRPIRRQHRPVGCWDRSKHHHARPRGSARGSSLETDGMGRPACLAETQTRCMETGRRRKETSSGGAAYADMQTRMQAYAPRPLGPGQPASLELEHAEGLRCLSCLAHCPAAAAAAACTCVRACLVRVRWVSRHLRALRTPAQLSGGALAGYGRPRYRASLDKVLHHHHDNHHHTPPEVPSEVAVFSFAHSLPLPVLAPSSRPSTLRHGTK
ncbi:hypothetical protein DFH27DRAFT_525160 [Peziza echinospora]|nr:hypothetical protein DFH27DRAFT_525160 [Peziza echinospora]